MPTQVTVILSMPNRRCYEVWHVLKGHAIPQPNTFSPDNTTTYVTAFPNAEDPCTLFALNAATGEILWCKELHRSIAGGSVESIQTASSMLPPKRKFILLNQTETCDGSKFSTMATVPIKLIVHSVYTFRRAASSSR